MPPQVLFFLNQILFYKYWIAFPLAIIEGPVLMVACGFLLRLGYFHLVPVYLVLVAGDFVADLGWYALGRFGGRHLVGRWGKYIGLNRQAMEKVTKIFHRHHEKILFISKITMGFGFALVTLVTAGLVKVNFKKYALINFFGGFVWTGLLLAVGFFFGNLFMVINKGLKIAFIIFAAALVISILIGLNKYFRKKTSKKFL